MGYSIMAEIDDFAPCLQGWIRQTWQRRNQLLNQNMGRAHAEFPNAVMQQIYTIYAPGGCDRDGELRTFLERIDQFQTLVESELSVPFAIWAQGYSDGSVPPREIAACSYYHFAPPDLKDHKRALYPTCCRLYVNTVEPISQTSVWVMEQMFRFKYPQGRGRCVPGVVKGKVASPSRGGRRSEKAVVFFSDKITRTDFTQYLMHADRGRGPGPAISGAVPMGTQRVADGMAWADEPPLLHEDHVMRVIARNRTNRRGRHSYGSYIASCLYLALNDVGFGEMGSARQFLDQLMVRFRNAGVNPVAPHNMRGGAT